MIEHKAVHTQTYPTNTHKIHVSRATNRLYMYCHSTVQAPHFIPTWNSVYELLYGIYVPAWYSAIGVERQQGSLQCSNHSHGSLKNAWYVAASCRSCSRLRRISSLGWFTQGTFLWVLSAPSLKMQEQWNWYIALFIIFMLCILKIEDMYRQGKGVTRVTTATVVL